MGNLMAKISRVGLILILIGGLMLWPSLQDTITSFQAPKSFEDVLEEGAVPGEHVSGRVPYLLDTFASMETWTENSRTHATTSKRTSFRYYVLPGGEGYLGLSVASHSFSSANSLVEQTYACLLENGEEPTAELIVDARVVEMEEELAQLFREDLQDYYGYTDQDLEAMGTPLLVEPRAFGTIRAFCGVGIALILAGIAALVIRWVRVSAQLRRAREEAPGPDLD
ncbi:MAG: hypothetical protein HFF26_04325 [Oscillospiraceae bacterium]|nr:hypothetical protein [Oscillospiraceae bacterium]